MIYSIQYLRAIASLAVVYAHTFAFMGEQGVDIFFVISGYIILRLIDNTKRDPKQFFLARFFRIAPMYYLKSNRSL